MLTCVVRVFFCNVIQREGEEYGSQPDHIISLVASMVDRRTTVLHKSLRHLLSTCPGADSKDLLPKIRRCFCFDCSTSMADALSPSTEGRQNKGPMFLSLVLVFTIIALLVVLLRVYVRIWITRAFGWDDGMVVASMVSWGT